MFDYLVDHARLNAWCSPNQDLQVILKPKRISNPRGVFNKTPHLWGSIPLPTQQDRYHLYQVGQLHPSLLGLFPGRKVWHSLAYVMGLESLFADVYVNNGKHLSRAETWVLVTDEQNLLIAVKDQPRIAILKTEPLYVRLYSNAFFSSDRADGVVHKIECKARRWTTIEDAALFKQDYQEHQALHGHTFLYINGVYVHNFTPGGLQPGDMMEFVYDSTVKAVIDFPLDELPTFDSILDTKHKYLLHYPGPQVGGEIIDYRDDVDVYLIKKAVVGAQTRWDGLYFHKNQNDAFRMVTHRDYSATVSYAQGYVGQVAGWDTIDQLTFRIFLRHSGFARPLINEHHRIKELYKLDEMDIGQAMVGVDATVDVWKAENLENSRYVRMMSLDWTEINNDLVQYGYGYNAIAKLIAEAPLPVEDFHGQRQITLPYGLTYDSTMFEYDSQGRLLEYHRHVAGPEYYPVNPNTAIVEGIVGSGSESISATFGSATSILNPAYNYRYYLAPIVGGVVQHDSWEDVTGDTSKYSMIGNTLYWGVNPIFFATCVKSDKDFLAYDLTLSPENGLLKFSIDGTATYPSGSARGVMYIPVGKLDLWLNGRALIENLDYFVTWPEVVIVNKAYLVPGATQEITVRATGFCNSDMTRTVDDEAGFVKYGLLSRNDRFDLRDDKVMRIIVGGATIMRNALLFSEDDDGLYMENIPNGTPYIIEDLVVPLRNLTEEDTYSLRALSLSVDQAVSDYLTLKLPESDPVDPDVIVDKYSIYSPFASTVMHDLINGVIDLTDFKGQYSNMDVQTFLSGYAYLLAYDPTQKSIDLDYVSIHPHNLLVETVLDIYQYNFLARAIKVFLDDKVDITRFVSIKPGLI